MLENVEEKVNALTKLADLIGKKTLVMWCIVTTITTGYLFIKYDGSQDKRIAENSAGYERLIERIDKVENRQELQEQDVKETKSKVDSTMPRLDTLIDEAKKKINKIKR